MVQDQASGSAKPLVISSDDELSTPPLVKRSQLATKKWLAQTKKGPVAMKKGKEVAPPITSSDELEDGHVNPHLPSQPMFHALEEKCGKTIFSPWNAFAYAIQRSH